MTKQPLARFYLGVCLPIVASAVFMAFCALLLERSGEYLSLPDIRATLDKTGGVYSSAVNSRIFWLKQEIYTHRQPPVAALGSSRVLQFRARFFDKPFANLGNMRNFDDTTEMAHEMFGKHPPKVLILGVDFWWFSPIYQNLEYTRSPKDAKLGASDMFQTAGWILSGKLKPSTILTILEKSSPNLGVQGITNGEGIDASGSFINSALVFGDIPHYDVKFKDTLNKISKGDKMFAWSDAPDAEKIAKLDELLEFLHRQNIHVLLVLGPVAPLALDKMDELKGKFGYIPKALAHLQKKAAQYGFGYFDFHDPRKFGSTDCEMIDGFHGGPVMHARMLKEMAARDDTLRAGLNLAEIDKVIAQFGGKASLLGGNEIDFLKLGCKK